MARSDHSSFHFGIHPGELGSLATRNQEPIAFIDRDSIVRAFPVPTQDGPGSRIEFLSQEAAISPGLEIRLHCLKHPKRCIGGAVFWLLPLIRGSTRNHSLSHKFEKGPANPPRPGL